MQKKLGSMGCRNQGYVLDGFPKTDEQAKKTFLNPNGDLVVALPEAEHVVEGAVWHVAARRKMTARRRRKSRRMRR